MSVQMPQRPEGIRSHGVSDVSSIQNTVPASPTVTITNRATGTATQLSLSRTARLADAFQARQSAHTNAATLLHTHAILDAAHTALQHEGRLYDNRV